MSKNPKSISCSKKRKRLKKERKYEVQLTDKKKTAIQRTLSILLAVNNSMLAPKLQEESVRSWVRNFNKPH